MKTGQKYILFIVKSLIVILAVSNLILLFIFDYRLPFFNSNSTVSETPTDIIESVPESDSDSSIQIHVPEQELNYDGSENLNLLEGVKVTDSSGTELTNISVFSTIKAGNSRKEKIIEYSATDENGNRSTAQRTLHLGENYIGPTIEILGDIPEITEEKLPTLMSILLSGGLIHAEDGFGKDVTSSVTSSIKSYADISGETIVTLTITNMINDSYSTDISVLTKNDGPVIHLITDSATLSVGDTFNFYNYIDSAYDKEGNDLSGYISVSGSVDTSTPGTYVLNFHCTDSDGNTSPVKTLTVTVQ